MENIVVALLDSGINFNDEYFKNHIVDSNKRKKSDVDETGHGSLCASAVIKENPNVKLYIEKILDKNNMTSLMRLENTLEKLLQKEIQIVSMSLTLVEQKGMKKLQEICSELNNQGKVIICSLANGAERSYPANFKSVIAVRGFILENEYSFWFNSKKRIQAVVDFNPYFLRNDKKEYQLFGKCNSLATAKFAGVVSRIMQKNNLINRMELELILESCALRNEWNKRDFIKSKRFPDFNHTKPECSKNILKLSDLAVEYLGLIETNDIFKYSLFDSHIGLNYKNAYGLLRKIEEEFNFTIKDYTKISRYDFYSIYTLGLLLDRYSIENQSEIREE